MTGKYFEATDSELNELKLNKILNKLNFFGGLIQELISHHQKMLKGNKNEEVAYYDEAEYNDEAHEAYEVCIKTLERLKDDYLAQDHNLDCTIREALFLFQEEYCSKVSFAIKKGRNYYDT